MNESWWAAPKGNVSTKVLQYVRGVDVTQAPTYNKFIRCAALYDMPPRPRAFGDASAVSDGRMHENAIASAVNTVSAQIATADIRATFDTDGADWSEQRRARHREWYAEAVAKKYDVAKKCQRGFKAGAATKGTAVNKVTVDSFDEIHVDSVKVDDIVVDELEYCATQMLKQIHHRRPVSKEDLIAEYPESEKQIREASTGFGQTNARMWAGYRPYERSEVMVVESWRLPVGVKGRDRYKPGRHTIVIDNVDLLDEEYDEDHFPMCFMFWEQSTEGWYGIGLVERNAGLQRALNRRNLQIERQNDQNAFPTTWVSMADKGLKTQALTQNAIGTVGVYSGSQPPVTVTPQPVAPQTYMDADRIGAKIFENSGVSRMAAQSVKPAGIETGVALREYRDQTTQRFAEQEKDYERFFLDTIVLILEACKKLGAKAPKILRKTRWGKRSLEWGQVHIPDVRVQIGAASTLSRTRAGRLQSVIEWAQAGIISQDDARRLIAHPDLERAMSLYNAAIENVESCLEEIADGEIVMPEPFMNLKLLVWRAQQQYLNWAAIGAPEEVLENLRTLIVQAAWMDASASVAPANGNMGPDMSTPDGMAAPMPGGPPVADPQAALAPQAMQLAAIG